MQPGISKLDRSVSWEEVTLQDRYWLAVQKFGLKRGLKGSKATHKTIKQFYTELNQVVDIDKKIEQKLGEVGIFEVLKCNILNFVSSIGIGTRRDQNNVFEKILNSNKISFHNEQRKSKLIKQLRIDVEVIEKKNLEMKASEEERKKSRVELVSKRLYDELKGKMCVLEADNIKINKMLLEKERLIEGFHQDWMLKKKIDAGMKKIK